MLAEQNPVMGDAAETIYELTADEAIREQCKAREKQIKEMNTLVRERELAEQARDTAIRQLEEKDQRIAQLQQELQLLKERRHMPIGSD